MINYGGLTKLQLSMLTLRIIARGCFDHRVCVTVIFRCPIIIYNKEERQVALFVKFTVAK